MPASGLSGVKFSQTASPTGRASATLVALGCNTVFTPRLTGRVLVLASGVVATGTTATGPTYNVYYGTGTPPVNNDAVSGTAVFSGDQVVTSLVTNELSTPFSLAGVVTGLVADSVNSLGATVAGTAYWFDIMFKSASAGPPTITFTNVNLVIVEF